MSFVSSKGNILCRLINIELYKIFAIINRAIKGLHCTILFRPHGRHSNSFFVAVSLVPGIFHPIFRKIRWLFNAGIVSIQGMAISLICRKKYSYNPLPCSTPCRVTSGRQNIIHDVACNSMVMAWCIERYQRQWHLAVLPQYHWYWYCCQTSNIRLPLVSNKLVDYSDVVGASPVGAAPTTSSFLT